MVQNWADTDDTIVNHGVMVRSTDQDDFVGWKKFHSANNSSGNAPYLAVTYNSYPKTPSGLSPSTGSYVNTTTPTLHGVFSDADGGSGKVEYEIRDNATGALVTTGMRSTKLAAGSDAYWTVPTGLLSDGVTYKWRARGWDGTDYSKDYSAYRTFAVDTSPPGMPTVSSSEFAEGVWSQATSGSFSFPSSSSDVVGYYYDLDKATPTTYTTDTNVTLTPTDGPHTFYVRAKDSAGNLSAVKAYELKVGSAAITAPQDGDDVQKRTELRAVGRAEFTGVTFQFRRSETEAWTDISASDVSYEDNSSVASWPVAMNAGESPLLVWDVASTLSGKDGPVQVRASFTGGADGSTEAVDFSFDQKPVGGDVAAEDIGPGSVDLLTGNFALEQEDVSIDSFGSDLTVARTFNSRDPDAGSPFGPGWTSTAAVLEAAADWIALDDSGGFVVVTAFDGTQIDFTKNPDSTYTPELGFEAFSLTLVAGSFRMTDLDGNTTTFTKPQGSADYVPARVSQPGSATTTTYSYDAEGRVTRLLAPVPDGVSCDAELVAGCRALTFEYASSSTATATSFGEYEGRLKRVDLTAYEPTSRQ